VLEIQNWSQTDSAHTNKDFQPCHEMVNM